jgi:hypothetical protein
VAGIYSWFVELAKKRAEQDGLTREQRKDLEAVISPVKGFFEELKEAGLVIGVVTGDIESGIACSAQVDDDVWFTAQCCLPIHTARSATIKWGGSTKRRAITTEEGNGVYPLAVDGKQAGTHRAVLESLANLVGEANRRKLTSKRTP